VLAVTKMLRAEGLEALDQYSITAKEYPTFYILNYSQIDSPKTHSVVRECRGLILDKEDYSPLAQGFERFFNHGECGDYPTPNHFTGAVAWEKIDGTCVTVWHNPYTDEWQASTRKMGYAEGCVGDTDLTFLDLFERALGDTVQNTFQRYPTDHTFVFELVSPESRVTKQYPEAKVYLINLRKGGQELTPEYLQLWATTAPFTLPKVYPLYNVQQCLEAVKHMPEQDEGVVAHWPSGYRVKIKNPAHVALAHLRNNGALTDKRILDIIDTGETPEYLAHFPEDSLRFNRLIGCKLKASLEIEEEWGKVVAPCLDLEDRDVATSIKQTEYPSIHFARWRKGLTFEEQYATMSVDRKLKVLNG